MASPVTVITNSFVVQSIPTRTYLQYDEFTPADPKPQKRQRLIHTLQTETQPAIFSPRAVYDGNRLLYASYQIQTGVYRVHGSNQQAAVDAPGWYDIQISRTAGEPILPTNINKLMTQGAATAETLTATNLLQLLLSQAKNQVNPNTGRAYYIPEGKQLVSGMAVELWRGFFQAVRPTIVCMAVLRVNDARRLSLRDPRMEDFKKIEKHLKNRLIYVKTRDGQRRTKTVREIVPGPVGAYQFSPSDSEPQMTIAQYYFKAYNITLAYPEVCEMVPGQLYKKKLPPDATAAVVNFAALPPAQRLQKICSGGGQERSPVQDYSQSEYLIDAGMSVGQQALSLSAHLLHVPHLVYGQGTRPIEPKNGAWNVVGTTFNKPRPMERWGLINLDTSRITWDTVNRTISSIIQCCSALGMAVTPPPQDAVRDGNPHNIKQSILDVCTCFGDPKKVDMIVFLLPSKADDLRTMVKYICDVKLGVRSQCLREPKIQRANNQYFNNVALKFNARLGGANATVESQALRDLTSRPFMIIGAVESYFVVSCTLLSFIQDVAHPGPGSNRPSVASLVWSHDLHGAEYCATTRVQSPRSEIISDLGNMLKTALRMFGKKYNRGPQNIVFFRDGVSEGEFDIVKKEEITAIDAAFKELWTTMKLDLETIPRLTFIVVGKRHHVSFFPPNSNGPVADRTGNCKAGLVVHQGLQNPHFPDFYLQSHAAIKGTSRSAHYTVLQDEVFSGNLQTLQALSFALCHIYAKATRSVSIPAPVYYADLACARGKFHIDPESDMDIDGSITSGGQNAFNLDLWMAAFQGIHPNVQGAMYFL
ncbi:argonaute-like protein [Mycena filopes]|nr:argonaute-like protein [Mycena filopes]